MHADADTWVAKLVASRGFHPRRRPRPGEPRSIPPGSNCRRRRTSDHFGG